MIAKTDWMARTADPQRGQQSQTYARHIRGVVAYVRQFLASVSHILKGGQLRQLESVLMFAGRYHDLGKLDDENQLVLSGRKKARGLPIHHQDAGVAVALGENRTMSATLIYSHHKGLPNFSEESTRGVDLFRDNRDKRHVDGTIEILKERDSEVIDHCVCEAEQVKRSNFQVYLRTALSFLVDADHSDSSRPNVPLGEIGCAHSPSLRPNERLRALNEYVNGLSQDNERSMLRGEVYRTCRDSVLDSSVVSCDSPVGTGKTTAVMAHLLSVAAKRNLRRVFVVLPFTNIINQSVDVYRKSLILPGEDSNSVVAAVHHQVDYEDEISRDLSVRWDAPIVVTTAVAFFETIAAARPSGLRRLHQVIGSAVFVDEAHAALPAKLLPISWRWIRALADEWSVYWVLASGSLVRFWDMPEVSRDRVVVPELLSDEIREKCQMLENRRIKYRFLPQRISVNELIDQVSLAAGPRLVILNTVQTAAVVAKTFVDSTRFTGVYHLSTALSPIDREKMLKKVRCALKNDPNGNWVLVGTSCVEAGLDLNFSTGFREVSSLVSLLQSAGRVNRNAVESESEVISFEFADDERLTKNPGLDNSQKVLLQMLKSGVEISPSLCTEALRQELVLKPGRDSLMGQLVKAEEDCNFPEVEKSFKIIDTDTRIAIVNQEIVDRLENYETVDWRDVQCNSVQLWTRRVEKLALSEVTTRPGVYKWNLKYDDFLGCMAGIVENQTLFIRDAGII